MTAGATFPSFKQAAFLTASYLTDPICKAHEFRRRFSVVDDLYPNDDYTNIARKAFLKIGFCGFTVLAAVTTIPGIFLRDLTCRLQQMPYIFRQGNATPLPVPESFSLFLWNPCLVGAGYAITDGGVMPWPFRIERIIQKIQEQKADIVSLNEVYDIKTALQIYEALKNDYCHFYLHIGPRTTGVSSGLFVASKFSILNPEFTAFPKEMLDGRTKNAEKGIFSFDLDKAARIFMTHLQHSEECQFPTPGEVKARQQEMDFVMQKIDIVKDRAVILTGDLNLDDQEYKNSAWADRFEKGAPFEGFTWGGDAFCAQVVSSQKRVSGPLNYDYNLALKGTVREIKTERVDVGYDATKFNAEALSDHSGLRTTITLK